MKRPIQKLHKQGHSIVVTVPSELLTKLKWELGTDVCVQEVEGCLVVVSVADLMRDRMSRLSSGRIALVEKVTA